MKWLGLLLLPLMLAGCDGMLTFLAGEGWQPQGNAFKQVVWQGDKADATAVTFITARNEGEWQNMWERVGAVPPAPLPEEKMAVAVLAGQKPKSGYRVDITSATREMPLGRSERFIVRYTIREPVPGKVYAKGLTSPWAIRLADETEVTPTFVEFKAPKKAAKKGSAKPKAKATTENPGTAEPQ